MSLLFVFIIIFTILNHSLFSFIPTCNGGMYITGPILKCSRSGVLIIHFFKHTFFNLFKITSLILFNEFCFYFLKINKCILK